MMHVLATADAADWKRRVQRSVQHDFYHLPDYHRLAEERGEGIARLYVGSEGEHQIALPLLIRSVCDVPGLERYSEWRDATSVYGYAGPLYSHREMPRSAVYRFQKELSDTLRGEKVVTVFSRLHPLIPAVPVLAGLGEVQTIGHTVAIDLTVSPEAQYAAYAHNLKQGLKRLVREGVACTHDVGLVHLEAFVELYLDTMRRVGAAPGYLFDSHYFEGLHKALGERLHLFVASLEQKVIGGALFVECDGIVQYHLSGTHGEFLKLAPTRLILDEVRVWATGRGSRVLHLGGGVGGREDSLYFFKARMSPQRHPFSIWRWVVLDEEYRALCSGHEAHRRSHSLLASATTFFPQYRAPGELGSVSRGICVASLG